MGLNFVDQILLWHEEIKLTDIGDKNTKYVYASKGTHDVYMNPTYSANFEKCT